jgi:hypothetical protein
MLTRSVNSLAPLNLQRFSFIVFIVAVAILQTGCSSREKQGIMNDEQTVLYSSKKENGLNVQVFVGRRMNKNSPAPFFCGPTFPLGKNERIHAMVEIDNHEKHIGKEHMFHLEWIRPDNIRFFRKYEQLTVSDSTMSFSSSVSADGREPGKYTVRVYHFRELIAEKYFTLVPAKEYYDSLVNFYGAGITFCRKVDKETGDLIDPGSVFLSGEKRWVNAVGKFRNKPFFEEETLKFRMEWFDPEGKRIYNKLLDINHQDTGYIVRSSLKMHPDKRKPGVYQVKLFFFNILLAENNFTLKPAPVKQKLQLKRMNVGEIGLVLCSGVNRKTGAITGVAKEFDLSQVQKVHAVIDLSKAEFDRSQIVSVQWGRYGKKHFFSKDYLFGPEEDLSFVISAITVGGGKRKPGKYFVRIIYRNSIIAEQIFSLK